jgi:hypothetical protein
VTFALPAKAANTNENLRLTATASSGLPITFQSKTPDICSVTGNSLSFRFSGACEVSANQLGSATIAPASVTQTILITGSAIKKSVPKFITCIKGETSKRLSGSKCPVGYTAKK